MELWTRCGAFVTVAISLGVEKVPSFVSYPKATDEAEREPFTLVLQGMVVKPADEPLLELLARSTDCPTVICGGHFPEGQGWIIRCDSLGMANGHVAVVSPVNEQNRNAGCGHYSFW